jgi:hypothetical protein
VTSNPENARSLIKSEALGAPSSDETSPTYRVPVEGTITIDPSQTTGVGPISSSGVTSSTIHI